ncbi:hypothetical protein BC834DRAFT_820082 [Gloeopeniophorella convolvens]|nr:hypothetical protein BC834DRAFT_820082 [Gloeopeniophorella convolvens]
MERATPDEILTVNANIRLHEQEIASIDAAIQNALRQVNQLRMQKAQHLGAIAKYRGSISLAWRSPEDVLALIFEHCAASGWANAPLVISHVCSKWRQASFFPRVWSHIHLTSQSVDPVGKTHLWLSRSLQSPLHVTVDVQALDTHLLNAFELILDNASRWHSFNLSASFAQQATHMLTRCNRPFPHLSCLGITSFSAGLDTEGGSDDLAGLEEVFSQAPRLSSIRIVSNRFPPNLPQTVADLSLELAEAPSSRPSIPAAFEMLGGLPSLRSLTLVIPDHFVEVLEFPGGQATATLLPCLERLVINAAPDATEILQYLQVPNLRFLHLRSSELPLNRPHEVTGQALRRFLEISSPPLELLELHDIDIRREDYLHCLALLPRLEELRLHETEIPNDVILSLRGPAGVCPRLKRLDLRWCEQLAGRALVDFVRSRMESGDSQATTPYDSIEEITVINCALVEESDIIDLARLTVCSVVVRSLEDHCRSRGCCNNARYRQRLRLRH